MIELPGWALEQDSNYTNIMTPESDDKGIQEIKYREIINPRTGSPRNILNPEPYLFLATTNQDQDDPRVISPRNTESRNKLGLELILPQEYSDFKKLFEQPKQYALPEYSKHNHQIPLQEGKSPVCKKIY